ncbi:MAG TPA: hypothetical protein VFE45_10990 [Coriobacteriia bacterium]|nr:hypothetical protein [Coriobacteriia bacterium]
MLSDVGDAEAWTHDDAWIFVCVPGRPGQLRGILSTADHYNHSVPNPEDLAATLARLAASGLVAAHGDRFAATAMGLDVLANAKRHGYERIAEVRALLEVVPRREGPPVVSSPALDRAYQHYGNPLWRRL